MVLAGGAWAGWESRGAEADVYDVVIYGGTSGAVTAAVQAAEMGASVIVVAPDRHLGGLSSGGLGYTDSGKTASIGGLSREFYRRVHRHYAAATAWTWQRRDDLSAKGQGVGKGEDGQQTMWLFEPHVAEKIFDDWLTEARVTVVREAFLDREQGVAIEKTGDAATGGQAAGGAVGGHAVEGCCDTHAKPRSHDTSRIAWAKLMARVGEEFPLACPACGGDIRLRGDGRQEPAHAK